MNENRVYAHTTISDSDFTGLLPYEEPTTYRGYTGFGYYHSDKNSDSPRLYIVVSTIREDDSKDDSSRFE